LSRNKVDQTRKEPKIFLKTTRSGSRLSNTTRQQKPTTNPAENKKRKKSKEFDKFNNSSTKMVHCPASAIAMIHKKLRRINKILILPHQQLKPHILQVAMAHQEMSLP